MLNDHAGVENPQAEWGTYVLHRDAVAVAEDLDGILDRKRTWRETPGGRGVVAMSFQTDCYQDRATADVTRACMEVLFDHGKHVRILTRNPILALQDLDVFERGAAQGLVTIGSSIPSLDADQVAAIEPRAPAPEHRLRGLREFAEAGVPTFVSMSPTYPTATRDSLRRQLARFRDELPTLDVVFHEAINPRGGNFQMTVEAAREAGQDRLADRLQALRTEKHWREYAVSQLRTVEDLADQLDVPLKSWPGKGLVTACEGTDDYEFVRGAWMQRSPEAFANGGNR